MEIEIKSRKYAGHDPHFICCGAKQFFRIMAQIEIAYAIIFFIVSAAMGGLFDKSFSDACAQLGPAFNALGVAIIIFIVLCIDCVCVWFVVLLLEIGQTLSSAFLMYLAYTVWNDANSENDKDKANKALVVFIHASLLVAFCFLCTIAAFQITYCGSRGDGGEDEDSDSSASEEV